MVGRSPYAMQDASLASQGRGRREVVVWNGPGSAERRRAPHRVRDTASNYPALRIIVVPVNAGTSGSAISAGLAK
jgi:hypothetical protein